MSNYLERIGQDKIEDREEIEQLTARVRELEEELERKMSAGQYVLEQLSASQLHAEQLREALETLNKVSNIGCGRVEKALAIPRDTSALDAYVSEKVKAKDLLIEVMGKQVQEFSDLLNMKIATLTRQRDLAVEALEKQGHSAGCRKNAFGDICTCGLDDLLSTIKESEAMAQGEKP